MRDRKIKDMAASVRSRLLNLARQTNRPYQELEQYYGMERFLYRLSQSEHRDKFALKGALLLATWNIPAYRATRDIDFRAEMPNDPSEIEKTIVDICRTEVSPDGISFDSDTIRSEQIIEHGTYNGVRIRFTGHLGKSSIPMQVDLAFGDVIHPRRQEVDYPAILDGFARPNSYGYTMKGVWSPRSSKQ